MTHIDGARLLTDLRDLARFGQVSTGVTRLPFSSDDLSAREWLRARMAAAGLAASIDPYGNVYGAVPGAGPAVLIGSHTDTVPQGGWLDGALGVMYGLEIARARLEQGQRDVDVVSFMDEEGTYLSFLGSRTFCGGMTDQELERTKGPGGRALAEVIRERKSFGAPARLDRDRHVAYLEAHIEQGPRLEAAQQRIGVVSAIVGIHRYRVSVEGQANHAGTTPMSMRRDAGATLIGIAAEVPQRFAAEAGAETVWNIGSMSFSPGVTNVVPAAATMSVEFRDTDVKILDKLDGVLQDIAAAHSRARRLPVETSLVMRAEPVKMDERMAQAIATAAQGRGEAARIMASGAGHDAQILAQCLPAAMLFVPSIGGRSHTVTENTRDEDIVLGCQVLADAVERILTP
jgi:beta-ureidopropionase / N-carbamoyl-L-amino-acid hydrolase